MLNIIKTVFGIVVIILAGYGLITQNFTFMPYMMLFLGLLLFIIGISEFQKKQKLNAIISILASLFIFIVFVYTV